MIVSLTLRVQHAQHPNQPSLLRELILAVRATRSPLNLARCRRSLAASLTPLQPAS